MAPPPTWPFQSSYARKVTRLSYAVPNDKSRAANRVNRECGINCAIGDGSGELGQLSRFAM
jgi:hypothetical protein